MIEHWHYANYAKKLMFGESSEEAIAREHQLIYSKYSTISNLARYQLSETINSALGKNQVNITEFLSVSSNEALFAYIYHDSGANLWSRVRHASSRMIYPTNKYSLIFDDICCKISVNIS